MRGAVKNARLLRDEEIILVLIGRYCKQFEGWLCIRMVQAKGAAAAFIAGSRAGRSCA